MPWPSWRGPRRDGSAAWLPERLPERPTFVWQKPLTGRGLAGVAATDRFVLVADRDAADVQDVFRCLRADTGEQLWSLSYPTEGNLDYGNSPRATPLVHDGLVYFLGAFGHLNCVELEGGRSVWAMILPDEFPLEEKPQWGACSSPLVVDDKLIVNPGSKDASLVALKLKSGEVVWKSPGLPASFGSLNVATLGGKKQIVGHDRISLGGWDVATGRRLWRLVPPQSHDFNVPTPLVVGENLLVATENNGTRLYGFTRDGKIIEQPLAVNHDLAPDSHSPVAVGDKVFGVWNGLHCLDAAAGLKTLWTGADKAFADYASIIAAGDRILVTSKFGELLLIDAKADGYRLISRLRLFDGDSGVLSHPALVGKKLYVRSSTSIVCVTLD